MTDTYRRASLLLLASALLPACGGGSSTTGPTTPSQTYTVVLTAFYDANNNGQVDPGENNRVPGVRLEVGGRSGTSAAQTGQAQVTGVAGGTHAVRVDPASLPAYYRVSDAPAASVGVPQPAGSEHAVALTLAIGAARPNRYMAFGDSITVGDGSSDGAGYRSRLAQRLSAHFGATEIVDEGIQGTRSVAGAARIGPLLDRHLPAYTLIHYGTNDYNDRACREAFPCYTVESLRAMIREARSVNSLPVVSTIIPANPQFVDSVPPERNEWVARINESIRAMAREERVALADPHRLFTAQAALPPLFSDHVHPNDSGYDLLAQAFFEAITRPLS